MSAPLALIVLFVTLSMLAIVPAPTAAEPVQDGVIEDGEYEHHLTAANDDVEIHWEVTGDYINFGVKGKTTGWVAIGLEPTAVMKDADMYFGWVSGGTVFTQDAYSTGTFGPHPPDTDQGGTNDFDSYGATEDNGWTTFELRRLLDTGDSKDNVVPANGKMKIIWANGANDNWNDQHIRRGSATIDTGTGEAEVDEGFPRWSLHAILMSVGIVLMVYGFTIVRKKDKGWLDRHRKVMTAAAVFSALGLLFGIGMVIQNGGPHLRLPHTWIGAVTLVMVLLTFTEGHAWKRAEPKTKKRIRPIKIWLGRTTLTLMIVTMVLGILTALLGL
jgi:hypothetical protein